ncbi:TLE family member 5 isoform X5 [Rattus norvegicus]|uniref:TLE family member 5 isoform X5 n=1 Tax=Rattus norvegicus TaxID=10116 RepID=UPI00191783CD|nr:TLE family member 5 isoform X5 [Rattus norvegicus]
MMFPQSRHSAMTSLWLWLGPGRNPTGHSLWQGSFWGGPPLKSTPLRKQGSSHLPQQLKFTTSDSCDRIKDEFQLLQAQYHSLKLGSWGPSHGSPFDPRLDLFYRIQW